MKKTIAALFAVALSLGINAQDAAEANVQDAKQSGIKKGDKVQVDREYTHYLTGEKISKWVYEEPQTVEQVGSKRFPNGILLAKPFSWVTFQSVGGKIAQPEPEPEPQPEPAPAPTPAPAPQPEPEPKPAPAPAPAPQPAVEPEPAPAPAPVVEENVKKELSDKHQFGVNLHAGVTGMGQQLNDVVTTNGFDSKLGVGFGVGFEYTCWFKQADSYKLGLKTGLGFDIAAAKVIADSIKSAYDLADDGEGNAMRYTTGASAVSEKGRKMLLEIPIMLSFSHESGFIANGGLKFALPVSGKYKLDYKDASIDAYYTDLDVHETDQVVTGKLDGMAAVSDDKLTTEKFDLLFALEAGYSLKLNDGHALDILAYCDLPLFAKYDEQSSATGHMIYVAGPKAGGPEIVSNSLMNSYGKKMNCLSAGLKLSFNF